MKRRGVASKTIVAPIPAAPEPSGGYQSLTPSEVLADLPSLDVEQLLLVRTLEESGEGRAVILDRIADLLVVREAARHLATAPTNGAAAHRAPEQGTPQPSAPLPSAPLPSAPLPSAHLASAPLASAAPSSAQPPTLAPPDVVLPERAVSPELVDQMGGLLAKDAARRTSGSPTAEPPPHGPAGVPVTAAPAPAKAGKKEKAPKKDKAPKATRTTSPNGVIVPTGRGRLRTGRVGRVLAVALLVALVAGGGAVYWKATHHTSAAAVIHVPAPTALANLVVKTAPAGYIAQVGKNGDGPVDLAQAAAQNATANAPATLAQDGFQQGYQRLWATADGKEDLGVFVYQFATAAGAGTYMAHTLVVDRAVTTPPLANFSVTGIPGAVGLDGSTPHVADVMFARGRYVTLVSVLGPHANAIAQQYGAAESALIPVPAA